MRTASLRKLTVGAVAAGLVLTGCGTTAEGGSASGGGGDGPIEGLRFMVPNSAGSGYDTTAREVARVMEAEKLASGIEVFNLEGAGGTVGLQRLVNEDGNADMLMQMGLGVVGGARSRAALGGRSAAGQHEPGGDCADRELPQGSSAHCVLLCVQRVPAV